MFIHEENERKMAIKLHSTWWQHLGSLTLLQRSKHKTMFIMTCWNTSAVVRSLQDHGQCVSTGGGRIIFLSYLKKCDHLFAVFHHPWQWFLPKSGNKWLQPNSVIQLECFLKSANFDHQKLHSVYCIIHLDSWDQYSAPLLCMPLKSSQVERNKRCMQLNWCLSNSSDKLLNRLDTAVTVIGHFIYVSSLFFVSPVRVYSLPLCFLLGPVRSSWDTLFPHVHAVLSCHYLPHQHLPMQTSTLTAPICLIVMFVMSLHMLVNIYSNSQDPMILLLCLKLKKEKQLQNWVFSFWSKHEWKPNNDCTFLERSNNTP